MPLTPLPAQATQDVVRTLVDFRNFQDFDFRLQPTLGHLARDSRASTEPTLTPTTRRLSLSIVGGEGQCTLMRGRSMTWIIYSGSR